ncbi:MarR family winged helix-turn-helix transcriptional regulator [Actinoallomurus sp. CA-150999]|uniref:MarR family winged helix-turn-helix transcriptional regulator n=1 Tax=Actinoallomurus sp. CA-150999 TaxID=3239887 RepID=UPI003D8F250B
MADSVSVVLDQWRRARPDLDVSPIGTVGRLMRLSRLWDKAIKDFLAEHGLESGEFDVLSTLRRSGPPYELTAGAFLKASLVTSGAITLRTDRMIAKGLVERVRDDVDRRVVKIRLTEHGLQMIDGLLPLHLANEARLLQGLDGAELEHLTALLSSLLESYGDVADRS